MTEISLVPLADSDREQFIRDNQDAFNFGALEEFGLRDEHFEEDGEIISRDTIVRSIDEGAAYRIMQDGTAVGGLVIRTKYDSGDLELLFVSPAAHSKGIGYAAWCAVEEMHPEVTVWETFTPYFEKRLPSTPSAVREQIKRITYYEELMQRAELLLSKGSSPALTKLTEELASYYGSDAWKRDLAADEAGLLPDELRRGVLSEDGLYDLLAETDSLND